MDNKQQLNTPLVSGSVFGLILGALAGPIAAVIGISVGAAAGFWYNNRQASQSLNTNTSKEQSSQSKLLHD